MMNDENCVLRIKELKKEYKLYDSELDRFKESFSITRKQYHRSFYALDGIDFSVNRGEKVGIIGENGAGKSTLLKIITGVLPQTSGEIISEGNIAALLELGAGFNSEYTGIENIRLNCRLLGMKHEEIESIIPRIIEFADIGDFINQPVKMYSSGMFVRLAFATQIFSNPDILIVDEALSVGDIRFQQKCYRAMDKLMKDKTVILVTHDTAAVTRFCDRVIWIDHGKIIYDGEVEEGLKKYKGYLIDQAIIDKKDIGLHDYDKCGVDDEMEKEPDRLRIADIPAIDSKIRFKGTGEARILACGLYDDNSKLLHVVSPLQDVSVVMEVEYYKKISRPLVGITIRDRLGNDVVALNSEIVGTELPIGKNREKYLINFKMPEFNQGQYTVTLAVAQGYQLDHVQLCWADDAIVFNVPKREYDVPGTLYIQSATIESYTSLNA